MMAISCAQLLLAQDVVVLTNGERIENVKVSSITDSILIYMTGGKEMTLLHDSVYAILYADGRYEEIPTINAKEDSSKSLYSESIEEHPFFQCYDYDSNGRLRLKAAFLDKTYSKECRKIGQRVYQKEYATLYKIAFNEAKKSGLSNRKARMQAGDKCIPEAIKISDEAVRKCAGEL